DASFGRVKFPEAMPTTIDELPAAERDKVFAKLTALREFDAHVEQAMRAGFSREEAAAAFIAANARRFRGLKMCHRTLQRWRANHRRPGLNGLRDARHDRRLLHRNDPYLQYLLDQYLRQQQPTLRQCKKFADWEASKPGNEHWRTWSYDTLKRFIRERVPERLKTLYRKGEEAYTNFCEPSIERDFSTLRTNEWWVADHHPCDVWVLGPNGKPVRPNLTASMDMRSRVIVGYVISARPPSSSTILSALASAVRAHGAPDTFYVDNGKDFDCYALTGTTKAERRMRMQLQIDEQTQEAVKGVLRAIGSDAKFAQPYHPQSKPIERFFRTAADQHDRCFDSYCGNCPENRPEQLAARLKRRELPTLEEYAASFAEWVEGMYHRQPHEGNDRHGGTPNAVYDASWGDRQKRTASDDVLRVLLFRQTKPVKVSKRGVRFDGVWYGYNRPELHDRIGQEVYLRVDDTDLRRVFVFDLQDRLICPADVNVRVGFTGAVSRDHLREQIGMKRKPKRELRDQRKQVRYAYADGSDLFEHAAAAAARERRERRQPAETKINSPVDQIAAARVAAAIDRDAARDGQARPRSKINIVELADALERQNTEADLASAFRVEAQQRREQREQEDCTPDAWSDVARAFGRDPDPAEDTDTPPLRSLFNYRRKDEPLEDVG
ncbi:MAG TPA: Mu transposase C-terminal domain-containing protein, partial [Tepidisphaeraceae bacterium]|nr:Mu transposase C-terminal domain-containing protein [Tepidisphaeraceae bacterium]